MTVKQGLSDWHGYPPLEPQPRTTGPINMFQTPACSCQFARRNRRWVQIAWCREHMEEANVAPNVAKV